MIFGMWAIYLVDALFEGHFTTSLAVLAAILTPIGLVTFYWRYNLIVSTFVNGVEVKGIVTDIQTIFGSKSNKDYLIHYEYNFNGQQYEFKNRVKKNAHARTLKKGQQVNLLLHEKTPHIAFIKEIYLETN